jgi:hypothetical protein
MDEYRGETVKAFMSFEGRAFATTQEPAESCMTHLRLRGPWKCQKGCQRLSPEDSFVASSGRTGNGFRAVAQG